MLTTDDPALSRFARELRMFGKDEKTGEIRQLGNDWFLDEIRSCVGVHQLRALDANLAGRRAVADQYCRVFANQRGFRSPRQPPESSPSWYQFPVFLNEGTDHDSVMRAMADAGVQVKRIYKPVHKETVFSHFDDGAAPNAERMLDRSLCLPVFAGLDPSDVEHVCESLLSAVRKYG